MAGNLMDNACKWAKTRVRASVGGGSGANSNSEWTMTVPGSTLTSATLVGERGERLDENVPGTGLGLAIVRDIAKLYGGSIVLDASPLGGLEARLAACHRLRARSDGGAASRR